MNNLSTLRSEHPVFHYQSASLVWQGDDLQLVFEYLIEPDLRFKHTLTFINLPDSAQEIPEKTLHTYAAHLGLAEMFNYWKLTASPEIQNHVINLTPEQENFWHDLLIGGMGEYFYVNQIDFNQENFVKIVSDNFEDHSNTSFTPNSPESSETKMLIPLGGGKDSVVTLVKMAENFPAQNLGVLLISPTQAASDIARISQLKTVEVRRNLDSNLFELNRQGFLNGHVPISSVFAFTSVMAALLYGFTDVAISNERSSNEGNVEFHGKTINHQYSKSFKFETAFRVYQAKLHARTGVVNYFSFLRSLYELQIAERFAKMTNYHQVFRSCNRGQKTNSWCGECPKCLFAFMLLYPFIEEVKLIGYFGRNLYENQDLYPPLLALIGKDQNKPFECVGTYEESLAALHLGVESALRQRTDLPALLARANQEILKPEENMAERAQRIMKSWNDENNVPYFWQEWLK